MSKDFNCTVMMETDSDLDWIGDVETFNKNGETVLHLAFKHFGPSQHQINKILNLFLNRGVDPNIKNDREETILHWAVAKQFKYTIDYLLEHNAKIDATNDQGDTIAHFFIISEFNKLVKLGNDESASNNRTIVEKESAEYVKWLLSKGFDFDYKNKMGQSALHWAIEYNLQHILPALLKHSHDIKFVCKCEQRTLLHSFINVSIGGKRPVHHPDPKIQQPLFISEYRLPSNGFSRRYAVEIVKILLERGVSVKQLDKDRLTALNMAINGEENIDIVEIILDRFTKVQDKCEVTSICAVIKNITCKAQSAEYYSKIVCLLFSKCANMKRAITYYAVEQKNLKVIEMLRKNGADFSGITESGCNLLHILADMKWYDEPSDDSQVAALFDILVSEGCDVNARDNKGQTPLHWASECGNIPVMQKLIAHGVDINDIVPNLGWTPLQLALLKNQSVEVIELLVDNGANVNGNSRRDNKPLHLAVRYKNDTKVLKLLLERGAEVNARDEHGQTALAKTLFFDYVAQVEELLAYGADINDDCVTSLLPPCWKNKVRKILFQHWMKLKTAGLPYAEDYEDFVHSSVYLPLYGACLLEITIMKNTFIDNHTSLHDWLSMNVERRYICIRNENFQTLVHSPMLKEQFPYYSTVILGYYRQAVTRKLLFKEAGEALFKLTEIYLPDICLEVIFSFLKNTELVDIIGADGVR